jgi:hypothetical protein
VIQVKFLRHFPWASYLPVLQKIHPQVRVRLVGRHVPHPGRLAGDAAFPANELWGASSAAGGLHLLKQERMVPRLNAENEVHVVLDQVANVRTVAGQPIFHDDQFQPGMLPADLRQQRRQVATVVKLEGFQGFAALQRAEHIAKQRPQTLGLQGVEDFPHLGVAGNLPDAEQHLQIAVAAPLVEGQQRRVLQRKHGEGRHQRVPQGNGRLGLPMIGNLAEALSQQGLARAAPATQGIRDWRLGIRGRGFT